MMNPHKAPGPDGYPTTFYQKNRTTVGRQVSESVLNLINKGQLQQGMSDALMILLAKSDNPTKAAHFFIDSPFKCGIQGINEGLGEQIETNFTEYCVFRPSKFCSRQTNYR